MAISTIAMIVFFLAFGLAALISVPYGAIIAAVAALVAGVALIMGR